MLQKPGVLGAAARFWQRSYASDYVGLMVLATGWILIIIFIEPFHRMFYLSNLAIQFPHAEIERVPVPWLFIYALFIPLTLTILYITVLYPNTHNAHASITTRHMLHVSLLSLTTAILTTLFLTDVLKNMIGRPRPDLIDRCNPAPGTPDTTLVDYTVCTQTDHHVLHDGWRSFPSGHSSFSFAGLGWLGYFFAGQLGVSWSRGRKRGRAGLLGVLIVGAPFLGAVLIAISRCMDYRHDVYDVSAGSAIGLGVAYLAYRRYFPALGHRRAGVPYPSPGSEDVGGNAGFRKVRRTDEEQGLQDVEAFELSSLEESESESGDIGGSGKGKYGVDRSRSRGQ